MSVKTKRICKAEGCERPIYARELCKYHYQKYRGYYKRKYFLVEKYRVLTSEDMESLKKTRWNMGYVIKGKIVKEMEEK